MTSKSGNFDMVEQCTVINGPIFFEIFVILLEFQIGAPK